MYVSTLLINTGTNPDRPNWNIARRWLRNLYRVHQRLCMAFPSADRKAEDSHMLKPFAPRHFAPGHVHVERSSETGFLFRIDPQPGGRVVILVLSALRPDWEYAFHNAQHLLAAPPADAHPLQVAIEAGSRFRFCLGANPVFRVREASVDQQGKRFESKWVGKRIPVPGDDASLRNWLERRAVNAGFSLLDLPLVQLSYVYVNKSRKPGAGNRLHSVRYAGTLEVTEPEKFRTALATGIGPAKAFGFGLMSVAPVGGSAV